MSIRELIKIGKKSVGKRQAKKINGTVIGAAVGLTVGAVAGVLLTPKSGRETRTDIANAVKEFPRKAKDVLASAKEKAEEAQEKLQETKTKVTEELTVKK